MSEEMKEMFKQYLKENLSVGVDIGFDDYYGNKRVLVSLSLEGEEFSTHYDSLPKCRD